MLVGNKIAITGKETDIKDDELVNEYLVDLGIPNYWYEKQEIATLGVLTFTYEYKHTNYVNNQ